MDISEHEPAGQGKVYLVEDDPMIRALTAEWIEDAGYEVAEFASGGEALAALRADGGCEVAVLDLTLPDMRGDDLAGELLMIQPDLGLLFATGNANDLSDGALGRPRTGVLRKPYSAADLAQAIRGVARR